MSISIDSFATTLASELAKYTMEVSGEVKQICTEEANILAENIKRDSPKRSKKVGDRALNAYSKGWVVEKVYENNLNVQYVIHNKKEYRLTHLLEDGYATRDGGRVAGRPHVKPNEEETIERINKRSEEAVSGN